MIYAVVRSDLKKDESEAVVYPAVVVRSMAEFADHLTKTLCGCGCRIIPRSAYPVPVLHQDDGGLVYLLLDGDVLVGESIDYDYYLDGEEMREDYQMTREAVTRAWARGFAAGRVRPRKCAQIEPNKALCDRPADYQIAGTVVCEIHARMLLDNGKQKEESNE